MELLYFFLRDYLLFYYFPRNAGVTAEMDSTGSVTAVEATLDRLNKQREELEELWAARKLKLDLCLQLRLFERDALEVRGRVLMFIQLC